MTNETTKRAHRNTVEQIVLCPVCQRGDVWQEAVSRTQYVYKGEAVKDGQEVIDYLLAEVASILETQNARLHRTSASPAHGNENMIKPKGYEAECWTPQQIMTDQHLRICSLEERIRKLRKQRDEAIRGPSCSSPSAGSVNPWKCYECGKINSERYTRCECGVTR